MKYQSCSPTLEIKSGGGLGNQMLQYMLALNFRDSIPGLKIAGVKMETWGINLGSIARIPDHRDFSLSGSYVPFDRVVKATNRGFLKHLDLGWVSPRLDYFRPPSVDSEEFKPPVDLHASTFDERHLVIHVRAGDVLVRPHPDYGPTPLSFMEQSIVRSNADPVFVGQLADDEYSEAIRRRFSGATFHPSLGIAEDFETIRRSAKIAIGVSTFSWLAAWFSSAVEIHVPLSGFLNPAQRPDVNLLPLNDPRYWFYAFPVHQWDSSPSAFDRLYANRTHELLMPDQLEKLVAANRNRMHRVNFRRASLVSVRIARRRFSHWNTQRRVDSSKCLGGDHG